MDKSTPALNETDYRAIFDANPDAVFILSSDGQILDANLTAIRRYGYSLEELVRMNAADLAAEDLRDKAPTRLSNSLKSDNRFEWRHQSKDGCELPVEIVSHPIIHHGEHAILASARDIRDRTSFNSALHNQKHILERILDTEPGTVYIFDLAEQRNVYINRHWLTAYGYTAEETQAMGSELIQVFHPDDLLRIAANHNAWKDASDGEMRSIEYRLQDKKGAWHWLISRETPFTRDERGQVRQILGIAHDITEKKQAETLLSGQSQVLEMIAAGTSLSETLIALVRLIEAQSPGMLGSILLLDEDGVHVRHGAAPSLPTEFVAAVDEQPIGPCAGSCGTAAYRKEAVWVEDIATDPLWAAYKEVALRHDLHASWSTPIFDAQREVLGTFAMYYRQPGLPQPEHLLLIDAATHIAAIAISRNREERVLRESEGRLRNIIDGLGPSMFVGLLTTEGVVLEANQQALAAAGLKPEDVLGKPVEETYWFSYSEESKRQMRETIARASLGEASRYDVQIRAAENQFIPLDFSVQPFRDATGRVVLLVPSAIVITERKRTEGALRESEAKFRAIIESSPVAMAVNDEHLNITFLNRKFIETFGYTQADIPTLAEWWPRAYPDPAYRQRVEQEWQAAVKKAQQEQTELEPLEYKVTGKDGVVRDIRFSMAAMGAASLVICYDLTEHNQAEAKLRKLSLAVEQSPNCIVIADLDANIEYVNDTFLKLTGYSRDEVIGNNLRILQSDKTQKSVYEDIWAHLTHDETWRGELINQRKDGSEYIESLQICPVRQADGRLTHYLAIMENITEAKKAEERIERLAHFDQLTGLPNRSQLSDRFEYARSLAQRNNEPLAMLFLDLDHFKDVNDVLSHTIGDQLLMEVAKRIKASLRDEDTVSRQGGDEFMLILHATDANGAANVAAKLIEAISRPCQIGQYELIVTPSIGIAIYPHDGEDFETLSKNADVAMYRVKQGGRNNFRFYTPEMQIHSARTLQLANALRHALERNELQLHYQPQLSIQDGHIVGAEALLRWRHPELGMITPAEFIPIAEDSGQIIPIGEWVLRTATRQLKDWIDSGLPPMVMAVNLSAVQFRQANIVELVTHICDEANLPHEYLELELTEAVAMDNPLAAIEVMNKLHERNIRMSIDDFGTGYSSLSYLKKFKVYKLKIDQSFVRDITDDPDDKAIVSAIINMASSLGIQTIAEGVETAGQLAFLRLQGCDEVQGYYFSKPLTAEQFETFLISN